MTPITMAFISGFGLGGVSTFLFLLTVFKKN